MYCTSCNREYPADARRCGYCGNALVEQGLMRYPIGARPPALPGPPPVVSGAPPASRNPVTAALLSFIPMAIGQFYNGDIKKGLIMWGAYFVAGLTSEIGIGVILFFGVWIWSMVDAYSVAAGTGKRW